jgi:acetyl-CoA acyltransferase 2
MSAALARGVFIVAGKRTPFGAFGGKMKDISAIDLAAMANRAALDAGGVSPENVDSVIIGNVLHSSLDAALIARHSALKAGIPIHVPALTVNRLCGSGFQSVVNAVQEIDTGLSNVVVTGGSENMSASPHWVRGLRWGLPLGKEPKLEDVLWAGLSDSYVKMSMGITAENLAEKYNITRQQCDEFALSSQQRWLNAHENGYFEAEVVPVKVKGKKGPETVTHDEHPRVTSLEKLGTLPTVFKENGTVTAGNASGICDGAASVIVVSEKALTTHNLKPLARVVGYGIAGVDPAIMGIGPADAIRNLLSVSNKTLDQIDLVEVNEAFAPQFLAVAKELGLDLDTTNVNGGAIALGHPLAASGSRITTHLVHEMNRREVKYSIGSACIGGGQGIALLLENTN